MLINVPNKIHFTIYTKQKHLFNNAVCSFLFFTDTYHPNNLYFIALLAVKQQTIQKKTLQQSWTHACRSFQLEQPSNVLLQDYMKACSHGRMSPIQVTGEGMRTEKGGPVSGCIDLNSSVTSMDDR
jgi:hypothetical protein